MQSLWPGHTADARRSRSRLPGAQGNDHPTGMGEEVIAQCACCGERQLERLILFQSEDGEPLGICEACRDELLHDYLRREPHSWLRLRLDRVKLTRQEPPR
jgi:hypothetical protein